MIRNYIAVRDWETGSKNKMRCQPLQLACLMIDVRRLEIIPGSLFKSLIKPVSEDPEAAKEAGFDPLEQDALNKNGLKIEDLRKAPSQKVVWGQYVEYLKNYNQKGIGGKKWDSPIVGGYNNINFDDYIDYRMCELHGPKPLENGDLPIYEPFTNMDASILMNAMFNYHRLSRSNSMSFDTIREYMGYKTEGAHNAEVDVTQCADLLIRFFRLNRNLIEGKIALPLGKKIKFKGCVDGKL